MVADIGLPVSYPVITSIPSIANNLAVLESGFSSNKWIFENLIILKAYEQSNGLYIRYKDSDFNSSGLISSSETCISEVLSRFSDISEFLVDSFRKKEYIVLCLDHYYLPCSDYHEKEHFNHPVLIFAINDTKIQIADFFRQYKYSFESVSLNNFREAFTCANRNINPYKVFSSSKSLEAIIQSKRISSTNNTQLDFNKIFSSVSEYISPNSVGGDDYYGVDVYDCLLEHLSHSGSGLDEIRALHILLDHKSLMHKRISVVEQAFDRNAEFSQAYQYEVVKRATIIRNVAIKNFLKNSGALRCRLEQHICDLRDLEIAILVKFVKELQYLTDDHAKISQ